MITSTRRDFLKLLGMATACTIVETTFAADVITAPGKPLIEPDIKPAPVKRAWFKATGAMIGDASVLKICMDDFCNTLSGGDPDWEKKTTVLVGKDGDDFVRDYRTILITYTP